MHVPSMKKIGPKNEKFQNFFFHIFNLKLILYQKVEVNFSISKCKIALVDMKRAQVEVEAQIQI